MQTISTPTPGFPRRHGTLHPACSLPPTPPHCCRARSFKRPPLPLAAGCVVDGSGQAGTAYLRLPACMRHAVQAPGRACTCLRAPLPLPYPAGATRPRPTYHIYSHRTKHTVPAARLHTCELKTPCALCAHRIQAWFTLPHLPTTARQAHTIPCCAPRYAAHLLPPHHTPLPHLPPPAAPHFARTPRDLPPHWAGDSTAAWQLAPPLPDRDLVSGGRTGGTCLLYICRAPCAACLTAGRDALPAPFYARRLPRFFLGGVRHFALLFLRPLSNLACSCTNLRRIPPLPSAPNIGSTFWADGDLPALYPSGLA